MSISSILFSVVRALVAGFCILTVGACFFAAFLFAKDAPNNMPLVVFFVIGPSVMILYLHWVTGIIIFSDGRLQYVRSKISDGISGTMCLIGGASGTLSYRLAKTQGETDAVFWLMVGLGIITVVVWTVRWLRANRIEFSLAVSPRT